MATQSDKAPQTAEPAGAASNEPQNAGDGGEDVRVVGLRAKNSSVVELKGELYFYEIANGEPVEVVHIGVGALGPAQITDDIQNAIQADAKAMGLI